MPSPNPLGVLDKIWKVFEQGSGYLFGDTVTDFAKKSFAFLATWAVFIMYCGFIIFTVTSVFGIITSLQDAFKSYGSAAQLGYIIDVIGLVKPSNFEACISLVTGLSLAKFGLRAYVMIWSKLFNTAFLAATVK